MAYTAWLGVDLGTSLVKAALAAPAEHPVRSLPGAGIGRFRPQGGELPMLLVSALFQRSNAMASDS